MTFYLISSVHENLDIFRKHLPILSKAKWVDGIKQLQNLVKNLPKECFFLIELKNANEEINQMVLLLKNEAPDARIMYVIEDNNAHNLRVHQSSTVGGDAYVQTKITPESFDKITESLCVPDVNTLPLPVKSKPSPKAEEPTHLRSLSNQLDEVFLSVIQETSPPPVNIIEVTKSNTAAGENMGIKDQELSLGELGELDFTADTSESQPVEDSGMDLALNEDTLELGGEDFSAQSETAGYSELSLDDDAADSFDLTQSDDDSGFTLDEQDQGLGDLNLDADASTPSQTNEPSVNLSMTDLDLSELEGDAVDLSEATRVKLKEIDELMTKDASQLNIHQVVLDTSELNENLDLSGDENEDQDEEKEISVVQEFNIDSLDLNFGDDSSEEVVEATTIKRLPTEFKTATPEPVQKVEAPISFNKEELVVPTGNMERTHATISNLRADREELLAKIQKLEEEKSTFNRQTLSLRAELDETKIVLTITKRKMTEELNELKSKLSHHDEKRQILEEKNKLLTQELEKAGQKNRIDVKKVQHREKELEQKLELLKSDAETQIKNRDLKILELKRKIDAMEFDMESISTQEKRSVESRYELEDKLEKAIKTLKGAISVLEDESDRSIALNALKKNIDV